MFLCNPSEEGKKSFLVPVYSTVEVKWRMLSPMVACRIRDAFAFVTKKWACKLAVLLSDCAVWVRPISELKISYWVLSIYILVENINSRSWSYQYQTFLTSSCCGGFLLLWLHLILYFITLCCTLPLAAANCTSPLCSCAWHADGTETTTADGKALAVKHETK